MTSAIAPRGWWAWALRRPWNTRLARRPSQRKRCAHAAGPSCLEEVEPPRDPHVIRRNDFRLCAGHAESLLQPRVPAGEVQLAILVLHQRIELVVHVRRSER